MPSQTQPLPQGKRQDASQVLSVPIELIRPGPEQARRLFNADALAELAESIRESGIVQPIVLRSAPDGYEILAGERRWRAAQLAGLHEVPAILRNDLSSEQAFVLGLIENLQRESLTPMEAAAGMKRLGEIHQLTHDQIAERVGKSRVYVTHALRLLNLLPAVADHLDSGRISLGHAKVLAGLPSHLQATIATETLQRQLTVRQLERLAAAIPKTPRAAPKKTADWLRLEQQLADRIGAPVTISSSSHGDGALTIRFHSLEELDGILGKIGHTDL